MDKKTQFKLFFKKKRKSWPKKFFLQIIPAPPAAKRTFFFGFLLLKGGGVPWAQKIPSGEGGRLFRYFSCFLIFNFLITNIGGTGMPKNIILFFVFFNHVFNPNPKTAPKQGEGSSPLIFFPFFPFSFPPRGLFGVWKIKRSPVFYFWLGEFLLKRVKKK